MNHEAGEHFVQDLEPMLSQTEICSAFTESVVVKVPTRKLDERIKLLKKNIPVFLESKANAFVIYGVTKIHYVVSEHRMDDIHVCLSTMSWLQSSCWESVDYDSPSRFPKQHLLLDVQYTTVPWWFLPWCSFLCYSFKWAPGLPRIYLGCWPFGSKRRQLCQEFLGAGVQRLISKAKCATKEHLDMYLGGGFGESPCPLCWHEDVRLETIMLSMLWHMPCYLMYSPGPRHRQSEDGGRNFDPRQVTAAHWEWNIAII